MTSKASALTRGSGANVPPRADPPGSEQRRASKPSRDGKGAIAAERPKSDVASYVREVAAARREAIEKLRDLCRQNLQGYEECIEYGLPSYKHNGALEVSFASRKQYIALYVLKKDVVDEFRPALAAASIGKGCIRFRKPEQIDFAVIARLLRTTRESSSRPC
jgi:uncharacterized protein YdhG (YjbR/CyaY superfamily)